MFPESYASPYLREGGAGRGGSRPPGVFVAHMRKSIHATRSHTHTLPLLLLFFFKAKGASRHGTGCPKKYSREITCGNNNEFKETCIIKSFKCYFASSIGFLIKKTSATFLLGEGRGSFCLICFGHDFLRE